MWTKLIFQSPAKKNLKMLTRDDVHVGDLLICVKSHSATWYHDEAMKFPVEKMYLILPGDLFLVVDVKVFGPDYCDARCFSKYGCCWSRFEKHLAKFAVLIGA